MYMNDRQRLSAYRESLRVAWAYTDYNDWPVKYNAVMHLFAKDFSREFISDLTELLERGVTVGQLAAAFSNPARIYRIINTVIYGMKQDRVPLVKQRKYVLLLLDIVKEMKYGSEFNESGQNIILSPDQLERLTERLEFEAADPEASRKIQRFCGLIWAYTEASFFRAHDLTKELHGPYRKQAGFSNLIVRQYLNLNAKDIWKDIRMLPFGSITVYADYSESLEVSIDAYNHLYLHKGNYINDLMKYHVEADGAMLRAEELGSLFPLITDTIESVHRRVADMDWREIAKIYAEIYWYRKKPLKDLLDRDWRVPETVIRNIEHGEMNSKFLGCMSKEEIDMLVSTII